MQSCDVLNGIPCIRPVCSVSVPAQARWASNTLMSVQDSGWMKTENCGMLQQTADAGMSRVHRGMERKNTAIGKKKQAWLIGHPEHWAWWHEHWSMTKNALRLQHVDARQGQIILLAGNHWLSWEATAQIWLTLAEERCQTSCFTLSFAFFFLLFFLFFVVKQGWI